MLRLSSQFFLMRFGDVFKYRQTYINHGCHSTNCSLGKGCLGVELTASKYSSTFARSANYYNKDKDNRISPWGWLLLVIPISTFGLGCWQVKRKIWKEQLIKDLLSLRHKPPIELPEDLNTLEGKEYRVIKVRGKFLHDKELYIGPRSLIHDDIKPGSGIFSQRNSGNGYLVITPFQLTDRDNTILINRGWVSRKNANPSTRQAGQITDEIELTGILRKSEARPQFVPRHKGNDNLFFYRDLPKMCEMTGAQPVFLDATYSATVPDGPIAGQTRINLPNDHLSYLITWYSLSIATSYLWYKKIFKR